MKRSAILSLLLLVACGRQGKAFEFAESTEYITFAEDMPEDATESLGLVFDLLHDRGWGCKRKVVGGSPGQPGFGDNTATVSIDGPKIVWLPANWDTVPIENQARLVWHEYVHVRAQEKRARRMDRRMKRHAHWRIAFEVPALVQDIVILAHFGMSEEELREYAADLVGVYSGLLDLSDLDNLDEWEEFALYMLNDRIDIIFDKGKQHG